MKHLRAIAGLALLALALLAIALVFMVLSGRSQLVRDFAGIL